jgi:hypothetical protein
MAKKNIKEDQPLSYTLKDIIDQSVLLKLQTQLSTKPKKITPKKHQ